jgi:hypothetical protein
MLTDKKPNFFIVGAPKCGTTALAYYLSMHPQIYMGRKEMHFFGSDLHFGPQFYRRDPDAYLAEFEDCKGQPRIGESSVWYLFSRNAAREIKAFSPDARIIIMLREPVSMLYALYSAFRADGNEHLPTFREALEAEDDRRAGRQIGRRTYLAQGLVYREVPRFAEQVQRYFDVFGRERVHVIIYDDFNLDTSRAYYQALEFLGLSLEGEVPAFKRVNANVNGNDSVRFPLIRDVLNDPLVRGTAIKLRGLLPHPVFAWVQKQGLRLNAFNFVQSSSRRPPLPSDLKISLQREFAPEVERLSALLGRDLTGWSKPDEGTGWLSNIKSAVPILA